MKASPFSAETTTKRLLILSILFFIVNGSSTYRIISGQTTTLANQYIELKATFPDDTDIPIVDKIIEIKSLDLTTTTKYFRNFIVSQEELTPGQYLNIESKLCSLDNEIFDKVHAFLIAGEKEQNDLQLDSNIKINMEQSGSYTCRKYTSQIKIQNVHLPIDGEPINAISAVCAITLYNDDKTFIMLMNILSAPQQDIPNISNEQWKSILGHIMLNMKVHPKAVQIDRSSLEPSYIMNTLKHINFISDFPAFPMSVSYLNEAGADYGALTQNFIDTIMKQLGNLITNDEGIINEDIDQETQIVFAKVIALCVFMDTISLINPTDREGVGYLYKVDCNIYEKTLNKLYFKLALTPKDMVSSSITLQDLKYINVFDAETKEFMDDTHFCEVINAEILTKHEKYIQNQHWNLNNIPKDETEIKHWKEECNEVVTQYVYTTKFKYFSTMLNEAFMASGVAFVDTYARNIFTSIVYSKSENINIQKLKDTIKSTHMWVVYSVIGELHGIELKKQYSNWLLKWVEENEDNQQMLKKFLEFWSGSEYAIPDAPLTHYFKLQMQWHKLPEAHQCFYEIVFYLYDDYNVFKNKLNQAISYSEGGFHMA